MGLILPNKIVSIVVLTLERKISKKTFSICSCHGYVMQIHVNFFIGNYSQGICLHNDTTLGSVSITHLGQYHSEDKQCFSVSRSVMWLYWYKILTSPWNKDATSKKKVLVMHTSNFIALDQVVLCQHPMMCGVRLIGSMRTTQNIQICDLVALKRG